MLITPNAKQISTFWQQLQNTIEQLLSSRSDNHFQAASLLETYQEQLQKIDQNLTFHFQSDEENNGSIEMIFGCDGFTESIQSVFHLIEEAPELTGIEFKAFTERCNPIPNLVTIGNQTFNINEFWYRADIIKNKLQLEIYMQDIANSSGIDSRTEAVMIYLDALIGEYELMTRVWQLDWLKLPPSPAEQGLTPLADLRTKFDKIKHKIKPIGIILH